MVARLQDKGFASGEFGLRLERAEKMAKLTLNAKPCRIVCSSVCMGWVKLVADYCIVAFHFASLWSLTAPYATDWEYSLLSARSTR